MKHIQMTERLYISCFFGFNDSIYQEEASINSQFNQGL